MGSVINLAGRLNEQQKSLIKQGVLEGKEWKEVHALVSGIAPVTQALVKEMMEKYSSGLHVKAEAKLEGARLIEQFLKEAKEGADVDSMAALLEQALYRDILRRYMEAGDPLVSMTMEQLLKLDITYRTARLARQKLGVEKPERQSDSEGAGIESLREIFNAKQ